MAARKPTSEPIPAQKGKVTIDAIAEAAGVSKATVSRVLHGNPSVQEKLRSRVEAVIRQYHYQPNIFAQRLRQAEGFGPAFEDRIQRQRELKQAIAQAAVHLVEEEMTVLLDAGSTTLELARLFHRFRHLTVVTLSLAAIDVLRQQSHTLIVAGGVYVPAMAATGGAGAVKAIRQVRADLAFVGASGFSLRHGIHCYSLDGCRIKRAMIAQSRQTVVLVDSSKFGQQGPRRYIPATMVDVVVTDRDDKLRAEAAGPLPFRVVTPPSMA